MCIGRGEFVARVGIFHISVSFIRTARDEKMKLEGVEKSCKHACLDKKEKEAAYLHFSFVF